MPRLIAPIAAACVAATGFASAQAIPPPGIANFSRMDLLPQLKSSVRTDSISSYDRTGGNDDGFSGRYSFVRKEGDGLVVADLKGPGCITRIWTPTPTDDPLEFYFDGETTPRVTIGFRELFLGTKPPFVAPLSGYGTGGFYCYVPMPYQKSCKVVLRGKLMQFYQINYATYDAAAPVTTFQPDAAELRGPAMERAQKLLATTGGDVSAFGTPEGSHVKVTRVTGQLKPGGTVSLLNARGGGRVLGIRIKGAHSLARKDRAVVLRAYWDGNKSPAILCPAGDFFGAAWGQPAMRSVMIGTDAVSDTDYCYFPMPFQKSARIELSSDAPGDSAIDVTADVITADKPLQPGEGHFYSTWRRESPTTQGKPFNYVTVEGRGHVVGVALQAQGSVPGITPFFEGDDQAWLDGELRIHGTGSEDFFNGGWYDVPGRWEARASYPLSGCLQYSRPMARSGGYRLFLQDEYSFKHTLKLDMEHAPEHNDFVADYTSVTWLYLEKPPTTPWSLPDVAARTVTDPTRLVFSPGWYTPIHAFSMQNAVLTKLSEQYDREHRSLSLQAKGENMFGEHLISFLCTVPAAGKYRVSIEPITSPDGCIVQLFQNERAMGPKADTYATKRGPHAAMPLGTLELNEGQNQIFIKLVGKNPAAAGDGLRFDVETVLLDKE